MFFKRINDNTINCIITPEDLSEQGIQIEDLFERKEEALAFLRRVILEAARAENFTLKGDNASMRISVLPDHSVSLTLSDGVPSGSGDTKTVQDVINQIRSKLESSSSSASAGDQDNAQMLPTGKSVSGSSRNKQDNKLAPQSGKNTSGRIDEYGYVFYNMNDVIDCCRNIKDTDCYFSSLYEDRQAGEFYLLLRRKGTDVDAGFEKIVLSMNEFADPIDDGAEYLAYVKEHEKCVLKENAVQKLAQL